MLKWCRMLATWLRRAKYIMKLIFRERQWYSKACNAAVWDLVGTHVGMDADFEAKNWKCWNYFMSQSRSWTLLRRDDFDERLGCAKGMCVSAFFEILLWHKESGFVKWLKLHIFLFLSVCLSVCLSLSLSLSPSRPSPPYYAWLLEVYHADKWWGSLWVWPLMNDYVTDCCEVFDACDPTPRC